MDPILSVSLLVIVISVIVVGTVVIRLQNTTRRLTYQMTGVQRRTANVLRRVGQFEDTMRTITGNDPVDDSPARLTLGSRTVHAPGVPSGARAYIAGPVSGRPDMNRPAFTAAARRAAAVGWVPVVPIDLGPLHPGPPCMVPGGAPTQPGPDGTPHTWECLMRMSLMAMLGCDLIVLLPGWVQSRGARAEQGLAHLLGMPQVWFTPDGGMVVPLAELVDEDSPTGPVHR